MSSVGGVGNKGGTPPPTEGTGDTQGLNNKVMASLDTYIKVLQEKGGKLDQAQQQVKVQLESPGLDKADMLAALLEARNALAELMKGFEIENIQSQQTIKQAEIDEKIEKINEAIKKMQESKGSGTWMKIFGWAVAGIMLIAAVAATIATGGSAAPLLVAAVVSIAVMVLDETGATEKILEGMASVFEAMGMDKDTAKIVATVVWTAAIIAVDIICMIASMGASTAGAANTVMKVAKCSAQTAEKVVKLANLVNQGAKLVGGISMVGQGIATGVHAVQEKEVADANIAVMEQDKAIKQIQAMIENAIEQLDEIIQLLLKDSGTVMSALDANTQTRMKTSQAMA